MTLPRKLAEQAFARLLGQFAEFIDDGEGGPELLDVRGFMGPDWMIAWPMGPSNWTQLAFDEGGTNWDVFNEARDAGRSVEEAGELAKVACEPAPDGVYVEALNETELGLWADDE